MTTLQFTVPDISCDHCVNTIRRAVTEVAGVAQVTADVATKHVEVQFAAPATREQIVAAMDEWGYPPAR